MYGYWGSVVSVVSYSCFSSSTLKITLTFYDDFLLRYPFATTLKTLIFRLHATLLESGRPRISCSSSVTVSDGFLWLYVCKWTRTCVKKYECEFFSNTYKYIILLFWIWGDKVNFCLKTPKLLKCPAWKITLHLNYFSEDYVSVRRSKMLLLCIKIDIQTYMLRLIVTQSLRYLIIEFLQITLRDTTGHSRLS